MANIMLLSLEQRKKICRKIYFTFIKWCLTDYQFHLFSWQKELTWILLKSIFVESTDVYAKVARQAGKTELVTLLFRFLIMFYVFWRDMPLMIGIASPKGEQAKTDVDRIKKSIQKMRAKWHVEDTEFNTRTIRAYLDETLCCEMYTFSLSPTTSNESKTLNVLLMEEAHKCDDTKRSDELDPMLVQTGGCTWHIGVGCLRNCDFKKGCDGEKPASISFIADVDRCIKDQSLMFKKTNNLKYLEYQKSFEAEVKKKGRNSSEIRRNYYLEDIIEIGNFIGLTRLTSLKRPAEKKINTDCLYLGIDWGRRSDETWVTLVNSDNDIVTWFKYTAMPYEQQIEMIKVNTEPYLSKIMAVRSDSTGIGDPPTEMLRSRTRLPVGVDSHFNFSLQSKHDLYSYFEEILFKGEEDKMRFSYPSDHYLTEQFEEQMLALIKEYKGHNEYLSVHHPEEANAKDDAPDSTALAVFAGRTCKMGDILIA